MTTQDQDYSGYETDESIQETEVGSAVQRVVWYNSSAEWHYGTTIERGGIGIEMKPGLDVPPFGKVEKIKHQGQKGQPPKVTEEMVATDAEMAIIAATTHYTTFWPDGDSSNPPILMDRYFQTDDGHDESKRSSAISLFVVFRADEQRPRKVWELALRVFNTKHAENVLRQLDTARSGVKQQFGERGLKLKELPRFCVWARIGAGETTMEGKQQQGPVTHIVVKWPKAVMKPADYFELRVSPDEFKEFQATRKELDAMFSQGFRQPHAEDELPRLIENYRNRATQRQARLQTPESQARALIQGAANQAVAEQRHKHVDIMKLPNVNLPLQEYLLTYGRKGMDELAAMVSGDGTASFKDILQAFGLHDWKEGKRDAPVSDYLTGYQNMIEIEQEQ